MTEIDVSRMTPEQRLKQIEILLTTAAKTINNHNEILNRHEEILTRTDLQLARLSEIVLDSTRIMAQQQAKTERLEERYQQSQAEIERIWQYLMSHSGNGKGQG